MTNTWILGTVGVALLMSAIVAILVPMAGLLVDPRGPACVAAGATVVLGLLMGNTS